MTEPDPVDRDAARASRRRPSRELERLMRSPEVREAFLRHNSPERERERRENIRRELHAAPSDARIRWPRRALILVAPLAAAALVLVLLRPPQPTEMPLFAAPPEIYNPEPTRGSDASPADSFRGGDQIQIVVRPTRACFATVLQVEDCEVTLLAEALTQPQGRVGDWLPLQANRPNELLRDEIAVEPSTRGGEFLFLVVLLADQPADEEVVAQAKRTLADACRAGRALEDALAGSLRASGVQGYVSAIRVLE